ncbi:MAG: SprT family zinc-dependent metalloprotease [Candidatus Kapaibacterium sp.]
MRSTPVLHPPETIVLDGVPVTYTVRRSPRAKQMRITVSAHNGVVVTLPARLKRYVNPEEILREKKLWLLHHLSTITIPTPPAPLADGSIIHFLGHELRIVIGKDNSRPTVKIVENEMRVMLPSDFSGDLKDVVKAWIRDEAQRIINREAERLAPLIGVHYNQLTVRDQKTKWGSCSKKGNLSFNWRLVLFPPKVIRYIVIHELCHLRHFNHSQRFWGLVEHHDPAFEDSIQWLKHHGMRMEGDLR